MINKLGFNAIVRTIDKYTFVVNIGCLWYYSRHYSELYYRHKFGKQEFELVCLSEYTMRPTENTIEMWEDIILFHYIKNR